MREKQCLERDFRSKPYREKVVIERGRRSVETDFFSIYECEIEDAQHYL